jgi:NADPH-dependent ferric siderophore reductase
MSWRARAEPPQTQAFFEVDSAQDLLAAPDWPGLSVKWLIRDQASAVVAGSLMVEVGASGECCPFECFISRAIGRAGRLDIDKDILWEIAGAATEGFYGWIAGESAAVMSSAQILDQGMWHPPRVTQPDGLLALQQGGS